MEHLTAGYITREVATNMQNAALEAFMDSPTLNVWLTDKGMVLHSQDANWPSNDDGIPLIGARVIRMDVSLESMLPVGKDKLEPEVLKKMLVKEIFTQVHRYVRVHENRLPVNLSKLALSNAAQVKSLLDFVDYGQMNTESASVKSH